VEYGLWLAYYIGSEWRFWFGVCYASLFMINREKHLLLLVKTCRMGMTMTLNQKVGLLKQPLSLVIKRFW